MRRLLINILFIYSLLIMPNLFTDNQVDITIQIEVFTSLDLYVDSTNIYLNITNDNLFGTVGTYSVDHSSESAARHDIEITWAAFSSAENFQILARLTQPMPDGLYIKLEPVSGSISDPSATANSIDELSTTDITLIGNITSSQGSVSYKYLLGVNPDYGQGGVADTRILIHTIISS